MAFYRAIFWLTDGSLEAVEVLAADPLTAERRALILIGPNRVRMTMRLYRVPGIGSIG